MTEHRSVQYICAQALANRTERDVAMPFADPDLLFYAAGLAPELKVHNRLNRWLVGRLAPGLSRVPLAATLLPAAWPIQIQELSRLVRRLYEEAGWPSTVESVAGSLASGSAG